MNEKLLEIEMQALICEREGYIAENQQRLATGNSVAYGADHFFELASRFRELGKEYKSNGWPDGLGAHFRSSGRGERP